MPRCVVQFVFKPDAGTDMGRFRNHVKSASDLWRKHGAETSLWMVTGGEIGNFTLTCMFPSFVAYGECMDELAADPEFQAWSAGNVAAGLMTWVRSNIAREIPLG